MSLKQVYRLFISSWHLYLPQLMFASSVAALGSAYASQYFFGAEPCILCLYQRVPYALIGVLGVLGLFLLTSLRARQYLALIASLIFLVGAGIAVYHVGVEQHWWASSCSGTLATNLSIADFQQSLTQKAPKACDELDWSLFGISMATYNVFVSIGLAVIMLIGRQKLMRSS